MSRALRSTPQGRKREPAGGRGVEAVVPLPCARSGAAAVSMSAEISAKRLFVMNIPPSGGRSLSRRSHNSDVPAAAVGARAGIRKPFFDEALDQSCDSWIFRNYSCDSSGLQVALRRHRQREGHAAGPELDLDHRRKLIGDHAAQQLHAEA